jgi:hypothetical protein
MHHQGQATQWLLTFNKGRVLSNDTLFDPRAPLDQVSRWTSWATSSRAINCTLTSLQATPEAVAAVVVVAVVPAAVVVVEQWMTSTSPVVTLCLRTRCGQ